MIHYALSTSQFVNEKQAGIEKSFESRGQSVPVGHQRILISLFTAK